MQESVQVCRKMKQIITSDKISAVHLLNKLDNGYNKSRLELPIAQVYDELKIKNVCVSKEMEFQVEKYLLSARFATKRDANRRKRVAIVIHEAELTKRIDLIENSIRRLIETYSGQTEIDETFILTTRFIAKNLRLLKRQKQVKCTYIKLPWEEIEFCLSIFIISIVRSSEVLYRVILDKDKMFRFLQCFLTEFNKTFADFKSEKLGNLNRNDIVNAVIKNNSDFKELYDVYYTIKNVHSLKRIELYLNVAMTVNVQKDGVMGKLVLERTLQVVGEYLKNTTDSPNVSDDVHNMLHLTAPRQLKDIITFLRNSLSHVPSLKKRMELENNEDNTFFTDILNDLKKIEKECLTILYHKKVHILWKFMHKPDKSIIDDFIREIKLVEKTTLLYSSIEFQRIWPLLQLLKEQFHDKTEYDIHLFNKMETTMKSQEVKASHFKLYHLKMISQIFECEYNPSLNLNIVKNELSKNLSDTIMQERRFDYEALHGLLYVLYNRIKLTKPKNMLEIDIIFAKIFLFMSEEKRMNAIGNINTNIKKPEIVHDKKEKTKQIHATIEAIESNLSLESEKKLLTDALELKWKINRICMEILDLTDGISEFNTTLEKNIKSLLEEFGLKAKEKQRIYSFLAKNDFENLKSEINKRNSLEPLFKKVEDFNIFSYENDLLYVRDFLCTLKFKEDFKNKLKNVSATLIAKNKQVIMEYFTRRLKQLYKFVNVNNVNNISNDKALLATEMLVLDITEILENLSLLADNTFFLEVSSPTLTGKMLRNYLAHGDVLLDALGINFSNAVAINAIELLRRGKDLILQEDVMIGQTICPDIERVKQQYDNELSLVKNQLDMFKALQDGDDVKILQCVENGGDMLAVTTAGWSWAHFVAHGGHLEIFTQFFDRGKF